MTYTLWTARACALLLSTVSCAFAAGVTVNVNGLSKPYGELGCSLFKNPEGFPMDGQLAQTVWISVSKPSLNCEFKNLTAGTYAISIVHDQNKNRKVDTNLFGIPQEQWGVSNNVRPLMRAPKFSEANFVIAGDADELNLTIEASK